MPELEIRKKGRDKVRRRQWSPDDQALTIGRSSAADVVLHHSSISRVHCTLERAGAHWRIRDHQSRHGMKINGVRRGEAVLSSGDRVHIGPYELVFHSSVDADAPAASPGDREPFDRDATDESSVDESPELSDNDRTEIREEIARLESALSEAREEAAAAKAELRSATLARVEVDSQAAAKVAAADQMAQASRAESEALRARLASAHENAASQTASNDISREVESLRLGAARMTAEQDRLAALLDEERHARAALEAELRAAAESSSESLDLQDRARQNQALADALRDQMAEALRSADDANERLRGAEESLAIFRAEVARSEELLAAARVDQDSAESATAAARQECAAMALRLAEAEQALAAADASREQAVAHSLADSSAQLAERTQENERLRTELESLRAEQTSAREAMHKLERELNDSKATPVADLGEMKALRVELAAIEARLADTERAAAERQQRLAVAQQNLEQFRRGIADAQKERDVWSTRARLAQAQVENLKKEVAENRQRIHAYESLLVDYVTQLQATGQLDAAVVEMSAEEIRRAQRAGATIVELDQPRR